MLVRLGGGNGRGLWRKGLAESGVGGRCSSLERRAVGCSCRLRGGAWEVVSLEKHKRYDNCLNGSEEFGAANVQIEHSASNV